mmetsp:Transcript_89347/g.255123  ORF Transcript_89347/g.255123 Transcript_89347/m.255123 type:complete len:380 (-) Transcript_89347:207-1346(-)
MEEDGRVVRHARLIQGIQQTPNLVVHTGRGRVVCAAGDAGRVVVQRLPRRLRVIVVVGNGRDRIVQSLYLSQRDVFDGVEVEELLLRDPRQVGLVVANGQIEGLAAVHPGLEQADRVIRGQHIGQVPRVPHAPVLRHVADAPTFRRKLAGHAGLLFGLALICCAQHFDVPADLIVVALLPPGAPRAVNALGPARVAVRQRLGRPRPRVVVLEDAIFEPVLHRVMVGLARAKAEHACREELAWQRRPELVLDSPVVVQVPDLGRVGPAAGHKGGPRRIAEGLLSVSPVERHAAGRDSVHRWGEDVVGRGVGPHLGPQVVDDDVDHVVRAARRGQHGCAGVATGAGISGVRRGRGGCRGGGRGGGRGGSRCGGGRGSSSAK